MQVAKVTVHDNIEGTYKCTITTVVITTTTTTTAINSRMAQTTITRILVIN